MRFPVDTRATRLRTPRTSGASGGARGLEIFGRILAETGRDRRLQYERAQRQHEAEQKRAKRQADAAADARIVAQARLKWGKEIVDRTQSIEGDGGGFSDQFEADFNSWLDLTLQGVPEDRHEALKADLEGVRMGIALDAFKVERGAKIDYANRSVNETLDVLQNAVLSNPNELQGAMDTFAKSVIAMDALDEASRSRIIEEGVSSLGAAWVDAMVKNDPEMAYQKLLSGQMDEDISPQVKARGLKNAAAEMKRREAERKRVLEKEQARLDAEQRQRDTMTLIEQGQFAQSHIASLGRTGSGVDAFDRDEYKRVASPRAWAAFLSEEQAAISAFTNTNDLPTLPADEIFQRLQGLQPEPGSASFDADAKTFAVVQRVAADIDRARSVDPAAYVAQHSAPVREAVAVLSELDGDASQEERQVALSAVVRASLAEQVRLGIPAGKRKPLSVSQVGQAIEAYEAAGPDDRGQALTQLVLQIEDYGDQAGPVLQQFVSQGLPMEAESLLGLSGDPVAQARLARAMVNSDELKKVIPARERNDLRDRVADELRPLLATFEPTPGAERLSSIAAEGAAQMAMADVARGVRPKVAARRAASAFLDRYQVEGSVRIPVDVAGQTQSRRFITSTVFGEVSVDERNKSGPLSAPFTKGDHIVRGMDYTLGQLVADDGLTSTIGFTGDLAETQDAIRASGRFITNEDETGVYLIVGRDGLYVPIVDNEGQRIEYRWDQLAELGRLAPSGGTAPDDVVALNDLLRSRGQ